MNLLIRGGRAIDPSQDLDGVYDVRIRDGRIAEIGAHLAADGNEEFDAAGACVAPGFIDMHVHFREPGQTEKETIATGAAAAVAGGFTAVACMPNTEPPLDSAALVEQVLRSAAAAGLARVYPVAAITLGRRGLEPAPYAELRAAGAVAFSDDGASVENPRVLYDAALLAREASATFISHAEDERLKAGAVVNASAAALRLGLAAAPSLAEDVVIARDMLICGATGTPFHIAHLSTGTGGDLIRFAKAQGWPVTCEVTPHHLTLSDAEIVAADGSYVVNPPLRSPDDVRRLCDAVRDGTIDVFATDHAPHTAPEKSAHASQAKPGFSGLETAIGAYHHALPDLPPRRFVELLSTNPARILGIEGGTLRVGTRADVTIFADRRWTVEPHAFHSKGRSTPFAGAVFERRALATIVDGRIVMRDGRVPAAAR